MSLVNDMLRDLDARRRDAPVKGLGSENLVPASDRSSAKPKRRSVVSVTLAVLGCALLLALVAVYSLWSNQRESSGTLPNVTVPAAVNSQQSAAPEINQSDVVPNADTLEVVRALEERLRQLEQQNQALMANPVETQTAVTTQQDVASWQGRDWSQSAAPDTQAPARTAEVAPARVSASSVTPATSTPVTGTAVSESTTSSVTRNQQPLSFGELERRQVQRALQEWAAGQQLNALQTLDSFTYEYPQAHQARELLAKLLVQQGEPDRAMQAVDIGLAISPNHAGYKKVKARLLIDYRRATEAVALLDNFPPSIAADSEYHDVLATALLAAQVFDRAAQSYRSLLSQDNTVGRWWYGLAVALEAAASSNEAANAYERALQQPSLPAALRTNSQQRLAVLRQE